MFTDKLVCLESPPHSIMNIKIKEKSTLFAIYAIQDIKNKTIQVFVCYLMQKGYFAVRVHVDEISGKFWLFKNNFGYLESNFKTTSRSIKFWA